MKHLFCWTVLGAWLLAGASAVGAPGSSLSSRFCASKGLQREYFAHDNSRLLPIITSRESDQAATLGQFFRAFVDGEFKAGNLIRQGSVKEPHPVAAPVGFRGRFNENPGRDVLISRQSALPWMIQARTLPNHCGLLRLYGIADSQQLQEPFAHKFWLVGYGVFGPFDRRSMGHRFNRPVDDICQSGPKWTIFPLHSTLPLTSHPIEVTRPLLAEVWLKATPSVRPCPGSFEYAPGAIPEQELGRALKYYHPIATGWTNV